jgi:hypothetical protein
LKKTSEKLEKLILGKISRFVEKKVITDSQEKYAQKDGSKIKRLRE